MGSQGYLGWDDAIHGYSSIWFDPDYIVSANSPLAAGIYLREITSYFI